MINFKNDLDKELSNINYPLTSEAIISKAKKKPTSLFTLPRVVAAAVVLIMLVGMCFVPNLFHSDDSSFIIVANAQALDNDGIASAEEITTNEFVELKSVGNTAVFYDFNRILNENADGNNLVQKYLFHSFAKLLHIDVVGENIETISYKLNKGVLCAASVPQEDRYQYLTFDYDKAITEYTIDYDNQANYQIAFNPVNMVGSDYDTVFVIKEYDENKEIKTVEYVNEYPDSANGIEELGRGFKSSAPTIVTDEEIETLKTYIKSEDMVGFFNYQNKIFERIINETTLDITVTKTDGSAETKTLQLRYNPVVITESDNYLDNQILTPSEGTISAKLMNG